MLLESLDVDDPDPPPVYEGIRTEDHKYVEYGTEDKELYDMNADLYELENRAQAGSPDPDTASRLQERLNALKDCSGQSCRDAEDAP
ncbi:MAG: hypothetical protein AVDCRST_MAG28-1240 [uncultured Rubrobacteraceae bacterium]|uniref:Uncharacterized protein n=1 Tax=uncultured Rubrobacteraceae bacterium TaxID=349277 RepID=A0A6J4QPM4_9ACTN|nr:MAG: hypothetical protein AVDCRST_MAG28-1240 [uncultured Rubrobacteraceae bacterium]